MDERKLNKLINYYDEVEEITKRLNILTEQIRIEEDYVLDNMQKSGTKNLSRAGYTLYIRRDLWASLIEHPETGRQPGMDALTTIGLGHLVKPSVNASQLSAYIREYDPDKCLAPDQITVLLPPPLQPEVQIAETFKLGRRKATQRKIGSEQNA